jgi:hypothetical protein
MPHSMKGSAAGFHLAPLLAVLLLAACEEQRTPPQPLDVLRFPTDVAVAASGDVLYVVGANFDRRYDAGVVQSIDLAALDAAVAGASASAGAPVLIETVPWLGGVHVESFGGRLARVGLDGGAERLFLPVRGAGTVTVVDAGPDGALVCHPDGSTDCRDGAIPLGAPSGTNVADPFASAIVGDHLYVAGLSLQRTVETDRESPLTAYLARMPLANPEAVTVRALGRIRTRDLYLGPDGFTLYGIGIRQETDRVISEIRSYDAQAFDAEEMESEVRSLTTVVGATDGRALVFSEDGSRAYALTRSPSALVVFDVENGAASLATRAAVPLPRAPSRIALVESGGARLAAITATEDDALVLVDLHRHEVVAVLDGTSCPDLDAPCPAGGRQPDRRDPATDVGDQPWALVVVPRPEGGIRIWVGAFGDGSLRAVDVPDPDRPWQARVVAVVSTGEEDE